MKLDLFFGMLLALIVVVCLYWFFGTSRFRKHTGSNRGATPISVVPNGTQFDVQAVCEVPRFAVLAMRVTNGKPPEPILYDLGNDIRVPRGAKAVELQIKTVFEPITSAGQPASHTQGAAQ